MHTGVSTYSTCLNIKRFDIACLAVEVHHHHHIQVRSVPHASGIPHGAHCGGDVHAVCIHSPCVQELSLGVPLQTDQQWGVSREGGGIFRVGVIPLFQSSSPWGIARRT